MNQEVIFFFFVFVLIFEGSTFHYVKKNKSYVSKLRSSAVTIGTRDWVTIGTSNLNFIPKYRHYDIAYCYIIVPNKSQTLCCRCKKASVFQALKLKIYLKYAFNLILTCAIMTLYEHQPVSMVCACMARQQSWNFYLKTGPFSVSSTCENHPFVPCVDVSLKRMPKSIKLVHNWPG